MKTLVSPPITPGPWTHGSLTEKSYVESPFGEQCVGTIFGKNHKETARFIAAAPAMAEALAIQLERMEWACENVFTEDAARWMQKSLQDMRSALLSAGYTLADDGKAGGHSSTPVRE